MTPFSNNPSHFIEFLKPVFAGRFQAVANDDFAGWIMALAFQTNNLDLALTKADAGVDVDYTGPHTGVFRFESVRRKALRAREKITRARGESFECALERLVADARRDGGWRADMAQSQ